MVEEMVFLKVKEDEYNERFINLKHITSFVVHKDDNESEIQLLTGSKIIIIGNFQEILTNFISGFQK